MNDYVVTRKMLYDIDHNGEIKNFDSKTIPQLRKTFLVDFEQFGQFVNKYDQTFELIIGATNSKSNESDYKRFNGKENCIVIQNWDNINICETSPMAFFLDMTDLSVIEILMKYFCGKLSKIIFDWCVTKFFTSSQLALQYEKLLSKNGIVYIRYENYGGIVSLSIPNIESEIQNMMIDYDKKTEKINNKIVTSVKTSYYEIMLQLFDDAYNVKQKTHKYQQFDVPTIVQLIYYQIVFRDGTFSCDVNFAKYKNILLIKEKEQKTMMLKLLKMANASLDVTLIDGTYPIPEHPYKPKDDIDSFFILKKD